MKSILKNNYILILLFIFAFVIRFIFIYRDSPFITHPDEPTVVNSTLNLKYSLNPKHFDWPTFYYYINYIFFSVIFFIERVANRVGYPIPWIVDTLNFYYLSRIITVVFGSLSVVFMYLLAKTCTGNRSIAVISAVILGILPFHILRSSQALTDVPMVFFIITSLYLLAKNLENFNWRNIYLSCFFAGLAVSTKYNGYMIFLSIGLFLILINKFSIEKWKNYLLSGFFGAFGFLFGTPYALLDYQTFLIDDNPKGALWQFKNVGSLPLGSQITSFFNNIGANLLPDFAFVPWILALTFIVYFFYKNKFNFKTNQDKFILILVIQFLFIIWSVSGVKVQRSHYFMALYSIVPLFGAIILERNKKLEIGSLVVSVVISGYLLTGTIANNSRVEFFERVKIENDVKNYNVLYSDSEMKQVLRKLGLASDEFDPNLMDFNKNYYSHIISSKELCFEQSCDYILIDSIVNREEGNDLYIYEIKR